MDILQALKFREFRLFWSGQLVSRIGDSALTTVIPVIAYDVFRSSPIAVGQILAMAAIFQVIVMPLNGVIVDKYPRIKLMIGLDVARFAMMVIGAIVVFENEQNIWFFTGLVIAYGVANSLFTVCYQAVQAQVLVPEVRRQGIGLSKVSSGVVSLIAPLLGTALYAASAGFTLLFNGLTYLVSLLSLRSLGAERSYERFGNNQSPAWKEAALLLRKPWLLRVVLVSAVFNAVSAGFISVVLPDYAANVLRMPATYYGASMSALMVGSIAAGYAVAKGTFARLSRADCYVLLGASGICIASVPLDSAFLAVLVMAFLGFFSSSFSALWSLVLQELIPGNLFGRVISLDMLGSLALWPVGLWAAGWATTAFGPKVSAIGLGLVATLVILIALGAGGWSGRFARDTFEVQGP